jgi:hypothetical protein
MGRQMVALGMEAQFQVDAHLGVSKRMELKCKMSYLEASGLYLRSANCLSRVIWR